MEYRKTLREQAEDLFPGDEEAQETWVEEYEDRSPWMICPDCGGDGHHSKHLGAFTQEDVDRDWDPEPWQGYLRGEYDKTCDTCGGSGKIREQAYVELCAKQRSFADEREDHHHYERGY